MRAKGSLMAVRHNGYGMSAVGRLGGPIPLADDTLAKPSPGSDECRPRRFL